MKTKTFMNRVANDEDDFFQEFLNILEEHKLPFCVIGGLAVNAYAEPVVSLDLDVVVLSKRLDELVGILSERFSIRKEPHSINVSSRTSDFRIQIQIDPRYQKFISRSSHKTILGYRVSVASIEDVLQGKIWAFSDPTRRPSKREKDLADIMRLTETHPQLVSLLPDRLKERLEIGDD